MKDLEGLDALRQRCPPGTELVGPVLADGTTVTVNDRVTASCLRPDGTPHGPSMTWYGDGSKASEGAYRDGVKEQEWTFWHDNGQISGRGRFRDGKPDGPWQIFDRDGTLVKTTEYRDGAEV